MARERAVFARELSEPERHRLERMTDTDTQRVWLRRALIVRASVQGKRVAVISRLMRLSEQYVVRVIQEFNEHGFAALNRKHERKGSTGNPAAES